MTDSWDPLDFPPEQREREFPQAGTSGDLISSRMTATQANLWDSYMEGLGETAGKETQVISFSSTPPLISRFFLLPLHLFPCSPFSLCCREVIFTCAGQLDIEEPQPLRFFSAIQQVGPGRAVQGSARVDRADMSADLDYRRRRRARASGSWAAPSCRMELQELSLTRGSS
eukprot:394634-Hanusia_phi.AAC.3